MNRLPVSKRVSIKMFTNISVKNVCVKSQKFLLEKVCLLSLKREKKNPGRQACCEHKHIDKIPFNLTTVLEIYHFLGDSHMFGKMALCCTEVYF